MSRPGVIALPERRDAAAPAGDRGEASDQVDNQIEDEFTAPADITAERAVAGALLLATPMASTPVLDRLRDDDFTEPRCGFVVSAVRRMLAEGAPVDCVTVAAYVERHGLVKPGPSRANLRSFLAELTALETAPVVDHLAYYADAVIVQAARRRGFYGGERLARLAVGADLDEYREAAKAELLALLDSLDRCGPQAKAVA